MTTILVAVTAISFLVFLVWISRHIMISRERNEGMVLTEDFQAGPDPNCQEASQDTPSLHVFVAAKDEEDCIEKCVLSVLNQDYPNLRMTVINDRSTDDTAEIAARLAGQNDNLDLMNIDTLPKGWMGKNNAMQHGIEGTDSEWICMIDADCEQTSSKTLSVALAYGRQCDADMLSVLPEFEMHGYWENMLQPICSGVMMIWFRPDKVNNPKKPNAYANGAFMLIKRSTYEAIGTHKAIAGVLNEDMQLALLTKRSGHRLRVVRSKGLYSLRMYTSLRATINGWSRIFFGTFGTFKKLAISMAVVGVFGLWPYLASALGFAAWHVGAGGAILAPTTALAGLAGVIMQMSVIARFYKFIGGKWHAAWTYPMGCLVVIGMLMRSMAMLRKGAQLVWRGTSYTNPSVS